MKYETAKALKEAGFPLKPTPSQNYPQLVTDLIIDHVRYQYPTLSELIDVCGDGFTRLLRIHDANIKEGVFRFEAMGRNIEEVGSTPEEAVANLYLALKKV